MGYSISSMFLFLLLLLVFPHIDNVLGARMELRELEEINHTDPVTVQKRSITFLPRPRPRPITLPPGFPRPWAPTVPTVSPGRRCRHCRPPPPPKAFPRSTPSH
ncbi:hypothetical protein ARALYDRAFT_473621 [Arabidopsis lyrata subsp. lyrata]|uniref:Transmembrane protein n=1 Tax=Arabidopsis lyrata subsp. lyrata TaxID=81972 RepID=D7KKB8_ARALL|nr:hypothetical protein ARALYDRAFT_473621 [Arabidopsis lyrata subsp. lyrata]